MLNERIAAARPVVQKINEVEASLNHTLIQMGELLSTIASARMTPGAKMPLTIGMDASEKLAKAVSTATKSYRDVVESHQALSADRTELGLDVVSWGDLLPCPPSGSIEQETPDTAPVTNNGQLRVVGE